MIYLLTSNAIPIKSIFEYNNNFILSLLHTVPIIPLNQMKTKYIFDLFYHQEADVESLKEDYTDQSDIEFHFHPCATMEEALTQICEVIHDQEILIQSKDEDNKEELLLTSCCDYNWNKQVVKYVNTQLGDYDDQTETTCINLYQYLKVPGMTAMVRMLKNILGTDFIYPEDPVAFGYAVYRILGGRI